MQKSGDLWETIFLLPFFIPCGLEQPGHLMATQEVGMSQGKEGRAATHLASNELLKPFTAQAEN